MCEGHSRCTVHPVYRVKVHRIDHCNRPPGPDGVFELCPACTSSTAYNVGRLIGEMYEAMPEDCAGDVLCCRTCQLWINDLSDVFDVEWVRERSTA